jgi:SAM-dependent methyltransferase
VRVTAEPAREARLVFGEDAEAYDRARPAYPAELVDTLVGWVGQDARVIDVGCGTGKAAALLAARGMVGVGVEAHPAMAAIGRRNLARWPGWRVDEAGFETWTPQPGDTPADLVSCAQAWHWLDPAVRLHRAHALLRPGGWLALFWNTADTSDDSPTRHALDAVYARRVPGVGVLPTCGGLPTPGRQGDMPPELAFDPPVTHDIAWSVRYTTAEWIDLLRTHSNHRLMTPEVRDPLLAEVADVIDAHGGVYESRYVAVLWGARRR